MSKAEILYCDIGNYLKREDKLRILKENKSFLNPSMNLVHIEPNEHGDWITSRSEVFQTFIPLASEKKFDVRTKSIFVVNSLGINSSRDAWVYNYSNKTVRNSMESMIQCYNSQIGNMKPDYNPMNIAWSSSLMNYWERKIRAKYDENKTVIGMYRPFTKQWIYIGELMIHRRGQFEQLFPDHNTKNLLIVINCKHSDVSCLISNSITDSHFVGDAQCFPLYYYEEKEEQTSLFDSKSDNKYIRKDGISDYILKDARMRYGSAVKKEDIFYYVYGILHYPKYRTDFSDDLKKSLPKIPFVSGKDDFWAFSKAGRELAKLHLEYEKVKPLAQVTVEGTRSDYRVTKMRFRSKTEKDTIIYNQHITVSNIPARAYEYIVNGKSAIEWVMERYQIKTDKASGITNDPNLYAEETGQPEYILNLLLSVIAVSVKTMDIVDSLPVVSW